MPLESLWGDIQFAFRIFKRSPAVAVTVIGTLAVALGLNATAYSFDAAAFSAGIVIVIAACLAASPPRGGRRGWNHGWR